MKRSGPLFLIFLLASVLSCNNDDGLNIGVTTSPTAHLYVTTHNGDVRRYDINTGVITNYANSSSDAEGIFFSSEEDAFTIVSRSSGRLETYHDISASGEGGTQNPESFTMSGGELENPRDLAVSGNFYVVSDNTDLDDDETTPEGRLFIYLKTDSGFILRNILQTKFKVWGIEFVDNDLYLAVDETSKIAVYREFLTTFTSNRIVTADKMIAVQGIVRAHGLDYDNGTMVLSDVGEAESASDGGLHIIKDFNEKFWSTANGGFISAEEQLRISGANTLLGNPVNVVYDANYNVIFVAEGLNNGGRVLAFNNATSVSGNIAPDLKYNLQGSSAVYFHTE